MKIAIAGVVSNVVLSNYSHNGGWTKTIKSILENKLKQSIDIINHKDNWNLYDLIILTEGVNYKEGSFNFFGGVQQDQITRLEKLNKFKGKLRSIEEVIDYNIVMNKRKELKDFNWTYKVPKVIKLIKLSNKLVLGDSHSISVFKEDHTISRNDGKTLKGFLNKGIKSYLEEDTKELIFYAGNIDVRFHIHRFGGRKAVVDLIRELFVQLQKLNLNKITLVSLLPIEDESRKIPGTGLYKDKPFFGTKEERTYYVNEFNALLKRGANHYNYNLIEWDFNYEEGLSFDQMESRQSVHLKPKSYKYIKQLC